MSMSVCWQPIKAVSVSSAAPSTLVDALEAAFGTWPLEIGEDDARVLDGIAAAGVEGASELACAVRKRGRIRVWCES